MGELLDADKSGRLLELFSTSVSSGVVPVERLVYRHSDEETIELRFFTRRSPARVAQRLIEGLSDIQAWTEEDHWQYGRTTRPDWMVEVTEKERLTEQAI